jgi:hypothetical protein
MADLFRPDTHYLICDRTGFKVRSTDIRKEYTGAIVRSRSHEARHPQDFVRAKRRGEGGPALPSRPQSDPRFMGALKATVTAVAAAGDTTIYLDDNTRFGATDAVTIGLDSKDMQRTTILSVNADGFRVVLADRLTGSVSIGAEMTNFSAVAEPDLG